MLLRFLHLCSSRKLIYRFLFCPYPVLALGLYWF
jgi:hypothetical protein